MVRKLVKPGQVIKEQMTPEKAHLWHMATGVAGEAGELIDGIKKWVAYNKPLDRENIIEELGDLEFYMEGVRQGCNISRADTLEHNMKKLGVRYEGHNYTDEQAHQRKDKKVGHPVAEAIIEKKPTVEFQD